MLSGGQVGRPCRVSISYSFLCESFLEISIALTSSVHVSFYVPTSFSLCTSAWCVHSPNLFMSPASVGGDQACLFKHFHIEGTEHRSHAATSPSTLPPCNSHHEWWVCHVLKESVGRVVQRVV